MISKNCLFCENTILLADTDNDSKRRKLCQRFVILNCRYFHLNCDVNKLLRTGKTINNKSNCVNNSDLGCSYQNAERFLLCDSCEPLAQQFCQVYDEWTNLQISYNWKIKEVTDKIVAKVKLQNFCVQENEDASNIFKSQLLQVTQTHWKKEFPRLCFKKLNPEDIGPTISGANEMNPVCNFVNFEDGNGSFLQEPKPSTGQNLFHQKRQRQLQASRKKKCTICNKMVTNLYRHKRIHTGEKLYKCKYCEKSFSQKSGMELHELKHTDERRYKCDQCGEAFKFPSTLKRHHQVVHVEGKKMKMRQKNNTEVSQAMQSAKSNFDPMKPFKCRYCDQGYSLKSNRNNHEAIYHRGTRPHRCTRCAKSYRDVNNLLSHQVRIHKMNHVLDQLKLEPGQFTITNEAVARSRVTKSWKLNSGEFRLTKSEARTHLCNICGKWVTNINRHKIIHTGIKPFKCKYCNAGYNQKTARDNHELTHESPNPKPKGRRGRPRKQYLTVTDINDAAVSTKSEKFLHPQVVDYANEGEAEDENESIDIGETFVLQQVKMHSQLQEPDPLSLQDDDDHHDHEIQDPLANVDDYTNFILAD